MGIFSKFLFTAKPRDPEKIAQRLFDATADSIALKNVLAQIDPQSSVFIKLHMTALTVGHFLVLRELTDSFKKLSDTSFSDQIGEQMQVRMQQRAQELKFTSITLEEAVPGQIEREQLIAQNAGHPAFEFPDLPEVAPEMLFNILMLRTMVVGVVAFEEAGLSGARLNLFNIPKISEVVKTIVMRVAFDSMPSPEPTLEHEIRGAAGFILGVVAQLV